MSTSIRPCRRDEHAPGPPYPVTAVVPVKRLAHAKSRLALPVEQRRSIALAFALDTISALYRSSLVVGVLVVTADPEVARSLREVPVRLLHDDGAAYRRPYRPAVELPRRGDRIRG